MSLSTQVRLLIPLLLVLPGKAWAGGEPPEFILQWGSNGTGNGQFAGPHVLPRGFLAPRRVVESLAKPATTLGLVRLAPARSELGHRLLAKTANETSVGGQ